MAEATLDKKSLKRQHEFPFNSFQFYNVPLLMGGTGTFDDHLYFLLCLKEDCFKKYFSTLQSKKSCLHAFMECCCHKCLGFCCWFSFQPLIVIFQTWYSPSIPTTRDSVCKVKILLKLSKAPIK